MSRRRRKSSKGSLSSDVGGYVGAGVGLGAGTMAIASMPGTAPAVVLPAFSTAGSMMGVVGTTIMAKHALRNVRKMSKKKRRY